MSTLTVDDATSDRYRDDRKFRRNLILAAIAAAFIPYQIWTYWSWYRGGVHSFTPAAGQHRPWIIPVIEVLSVIVTVAAFVRIVYGAIRKRHWTFDVMMLVGLILTLFFDTNINFIYPEFFYSSFWTNINQWWGYAPFTLNPVGSEMVLPIIFVVGGYIGMAYWGSVLGSWFFTEFKRRRPQTSLLTMAVVMFIAASVVLIPADMVVASLHLWGTPTGVPYFDFGSDSVRFSVLEALWGQYWLTFLAILRYTKFTAKGFARRRIGTRSRLVIATLATAGALNLSLLLSTGPWWLFGLYAKPFPENYPQHLIGNVCDLPGHQPVSSYGPCPGSPGFKLPLK